LFARVPEQAVNAVTDATFGRFTKGLTGGASSENLPSMDKIVTGLLSLDDAHDLAPLVAAYAQDRKRGAPGAADEFYAELLLKDRTAEIIGARIDGRLVGFAVFFDLPDTMSGKRVGQLDDLFVDHDARGLGAGRALIDGLTAEARKRGWNQLRWVVPEKPAGARQLAETFGERASVAAYVVPLDKSGVA
jgi:GNAT superfamily N-acetyltransferase